MLVEIIEIPVKRFVKVVALVTFFAASILAIFYSLLFLVRYFAGSLATAAAGAVALLAAVFLYMFMAAVAAFMLAVIYNYVARKWGGIELHIVNRSRKMKVAMSAETK